MKIGSDEVRIPTTQLGTKLATLNPPIEPHAPKLAPLREDARVIAIVGFGHSVSHFFHLIVAPIFPWLRNEFHYSYAELGFLMTVFFTVSGGFQAIAGFIVDRFGAGGTLITGLVCLSLAAIGFGVSDSYAGFVAAAALAGLGNSVFHPVDFSLINEKVSISRLASAYSVHGLCGSLGWGLAPIFLVGFATEFGWRYAVSGASLLPVAVIVVLAANRDLIRHQRPQPADPEGTATISTLAFMRNPKVWWCFAFFVFVSAAIGVAQSFAPAVFTAIYGLDVRSAALSVSIMMFASAFGMATGGWWASRNRRLEKNITFALAIGAASAGLIASGILHTSIALIFMGFMGFGIGFSGPSRDLLIRSTTPHGATGRVYGVVYSGLDVGIALAPVAFGRLLDAGNFSGVFYGLAGCLLFAVVTAWRVSATHDHC